jgi:hypothetical protein
VPLGPGVWRCVQMSHRSCRPKGERVNYNLTLQSTTDEQMLLNLVRLKYRDTPIF